MREVEDKIKKIFQSLNLIDSKRITMLRLKKFSLNPDQGEYFYSQYMTYINLCTIMIFDEKGYFDECINTLINLLDKDTFYTLCRRYPELLTTMELEKILTANEKIKNYDLLTINMSNMYRSKYQKKHEDCQLLDKYFQEAKEEILELLKEYEFI